MTEKRYVDIEALEKTVNDPKLPARIKGQEAERVVAFMRLHKKHFHAVLKDIVKRKDIAMVIQ